MVSGSIATPKWVVETIAQSIRDDTVRLHCPEPSKTPDTTDAEQPDASLTRRGPFIKAGRDERNTL